MRLQRKEIDAQKIKSNREENKKTLEEKQSKKAPLTVPKIAASFWFKNMEQQIANEKTKEGLELLIEAKFRVD